MSFKKFNIFSKDSKMSLDIKSFIPVYSKELNSKNTAQYQEFSELNIGPQEEVPIYNGKLPHQEFIGRILSPISPIYSMLLWHSTGSGKTCSSSVVVENFKNVLMDDKKRKPALILVKNDVLAQNYKLDVAETCVKFEYLPKISIREMIQFELKSIPEEHIERKNILKDTLPQQVYLGRLNRAISSTYEVITFGTLLLKFHEKYKTDQSIKSAFNNRVIVIDEVHNLKQGSDMESNDENKIMYNNLHRLLHVAENTRIILLTATPIWDSTKEIASIMNLILSLDKQLPTLSKFDNTFFKKDGSLIEDNIKDLRSAFSSKISYLRAPITDSKRFEEGQTEPYTRFIKVVQNPMSNLQSAVVKQLWTAEARKEAKDILKSPRSASNFVFPDSSYDKRGFEKHCIRMVKNRITYRLDDETKNIVKGMGGLRLCSSKFAAIVEDIICHPNDLVFVYSERVTGSGAILLGMILELYNLAHVKNKKDLVKKGDPIRRFAIITQDSHTTSERRDIEDVIGEFNRPDNITGDRIQVIIGSKTIAEGITLKNVTRVHILMPHWNLSALDQAIGRTLRFGSHTALQEYKKNKSDEPVVVHIFRHIATFPIVKLSDEYLNRPICNNVKRPESTNEGPDLYVYRLAEDKEYRNANIYRLMKEEALDCVLNYKRSVLSNDSAGSRECDFRTCDFLCSGVTNKNNIVPVKYFDNKIIMYSKNDVQKIIDMVKSVIATNIVLTFDRLRELCGNPEERILLMAVEVLIDNRVPIVDIYGFSRYLIENNDIYYLSVNPSDTDIFDSIYITKPIATKSLSLRDQLEIIDLNKDMSNISKICTGGIDVYNSLNRYTKIPILEMALMTKSNDVSFEIIENIIKSEQKNIVMLDKDHIVHTLYDTLRYLDLTVKPEPRWVFIEDPIREKEIREEMEKIQVIRTKEVIEPTEPIFGKIKIKDGKRKFYIVRRRTEAEKRNKGIVCITDNYENIFESCIEVGAIPPTDEDDTLLTKSIDTLRKQFKSVLESKRTKVDVDKIMNIIGDATKERLIGLIELARMNRAELCNNLQSSLESKGLLIEE